MDRFHHGWLGILLSLFYLMGEVNRAVAAPPNVVMILADDMAWTDYGFMRHPVIETPSLDRLAKESLVFTRGYVPTSLCRPSLMSIISGLYPHQHLLTGNDPPKGTNRAAMLKHVERVPTLPRLLATSGYKSFQSGKWWEGDFARGGFTHGMTHGDPQRGGRHGDVGLKIGRDGLEVIREFIESHRQQPFFLWYAPMLPHQPHNPPARLLEKYAEKVKSPHVAKYYAMCEWFDETCGELLGLLDKNGVRDNTIVVYVTDNGWIQDPQAAKFAPRSKRSPYDGGLRTPIIVNWPAKVAPRRDDATLVSSIDLVPTLLYACGQKPTPEMQGIDLLKLTAESKSPREALFGAIFEHDEPDIDDAASGLLFRWCIAGDWKIIATADGKQNELYNIAADPSEQTNLAIEKPELVQQLAKRIDQWWPVQPKP